MGSLLSGMTTNAWAYSALFAVILGNVLGQYFLKIGAALDVPGYKVLGLFGWHTLAGISCFAFSLLFYAWALRFLDLNVAQAVVSLQFVGAILLAAFVFGEEISPERWVGLTMIFLGLLVCSR